MLRLLVLVVLIVAASLLWSIHQTQSDPAVAYFSTFTRAWELGLGAGLAIAAHRLTRLPDVVRVLMGWGGLAAIVMAAVLFDASTPFPGAAALLPTVGATLLIAAGIGSSGPRAAVSRVLSVAPMRFIGDRSYTLYLWHWPVLVLVNERYGPVSTSTKLLLVIAAFALSIVTYALYEDPLRRSERWQYRHADLRPLWLCLPLAAIFIAAFYQQKIDNTIQATAVASQQITPTYATGPTPKQTAAQRRQQRQDLAAIDRAVRTQAPLPAVLAAAKAADNSAPIPGALSPAPQTGSFPTDIYTLGGCAAKAGAAGTKSRICRMGDTRASRTMVVFGDSHAEMWMGAILNMARRRGWAVIPLIKSACTIQMWGGVRPVPGCAAWFRWAAREDRALRPRLTLITSDYQTAGTGVTPFIAAQLRALIHSFRKTSQKVVVMGDVFGQTQQPIDCLLASHPTMGTCSSPYDQGQILENNIIHDVVSAAGGGFINTEGWFCALDQCPMVIGHTVAYFDNTHITREYAAQLSVPFRAAFLQAASRAKP